tara:strand:- start:1206 stop:1688 length:483 start_codon:yes stop_codon:yes gene_type:complete
MSTRRDRFLKIKPKRKQKVIDAIRSLSALSSHNYDYKSSEISQIFNELQRELDSARLKFVGTSATDRFHELMNRDIEQFKIMKDADPELYQEIIEKYNESYLSTYLKNLEKKEVKDSSFFYDLRNNKAFKDFEKRMDSLENVVKTQIGTLSLWIEKNVKD